MGNDDEDREYDEAPLTPRCGYCENPLFSKRAGAEYCGRRCKELAAAKRRRGRARVTKLRAKYPLADLSLAELHERATPPRPAVNEDQGDDAGHYDDEDDEYRHEQPGAWSDLWRLNEAIETIQARYEAALAPFRAQLRRNPGVRPTGLVELERQRDDEIAAMIRAHEHADDLDRARRHEPRRLNEAYERQRERAALQALSNDLPGRSRRYQAPEYHGRATADIWRW